MAQNNAVLNRDFLGVFRDLCVWCFFKSVVLTHEKLFIFHFIQWVGTFLWQNLFLIFHPVKDFKGLYPITLLVWGGYSLAPLQKKLQLNIIVNSLCQRGREKENVAYKTLRLFKVVIIKILKIKLTILDVKFQCH